jgi:cell division protein FtsA
MRMSKEKVQYFTSLEVGSSKVVMALARVSGEKLEIVSVAQHSHKGLHQGQIIDAREITTAIRKIKTELELTHDIVIHEVYASVADITLESAYAKGVLSIKKAVTEKDIELVKKVAEDLVPMRSDRQIIHHATHFFKVGSQKLFKAPVGQKATSLEVHSQLLVGAKKTLQTIRDCAAHSNLQILEFVPQPMACSEVLLTAEDKEMGTAIVDIGGAMTQLIVFKEGKMVLCQTLPIGGSHFTNDLAVGLRTPQSAAEKIKKNNGAALVDLISEDETVEVETLKGEGMQVVHSKLVAEILEARAEETLGLILRKLNDEGLLGKIQGGLVLTGGGSQLPGLAELGEFTFDIPIRRGGLNNILSTNPLAQGPAMSVTVGLLQHARNRQSFETGEFSLDTFKATLSRVRNYFENLL